MPECRFSLSPRAQPEGKSPMFGTTQPDKPVAWSAWSAASLVTPEAAHTPNQASPRSSSTASGSSSSPRYCAKHAPKRSIHYSQLCCHPQCGKVASFEANESHLRGRYAAQRDKWRRNGNTRSFSAGSDRVVFCASHAPPGVLDYRHAKCAAINCQSQGIWIDPAPLKRTSEAYCHKHRLGFMVLRAPRKLPNSTSPSGGKEPRGRQASEAADDPRHEEGGRRCGARHEPRRRACLLRGRHEGTEALLIQGADARGRALPHHRTCMHPLGCKRSASFGLPGGKPQFCAAHRAGNHTYVRRRCQVAGCDSRPTFGVSGCFTHCRAHRCSFCFCCGGDGICCRRDEMSCVVGRHCHAQARCVVLLSAEHFT
jgi:hypothetical protein